MRAIWKGHIQFSLVTIPVKIYNAIDTAKSISFNQLSKEGHNPVKYEKRDKVTGDLLKSEDIVKGYQYEPGQFVIIEPEDLDKVKLKSSKVIEIEGFVDKNEIQHTLFDAPYFAGPDGDVAGKTYSLLCQTLKESGKVGVGKVILRDRESIVLLSPQESGIMLYKLRYPEEVRNMTDVPNLPEEVTADKEQVNMAKMLVETMTKKFDTFKLEDKYNGALREMINQKIDGKEVVTVSEEEPQVVDIMTALKASIDAAKATKKPMKKASGKKAEKKVRKAKKAG